MLFYGVLSSSLYTSLTDPWILGLLIYVVHLHEVCVILSGVSCMAVWVTMICTGPAKLVSIPAIEHRSLPLSSIYYLAHAGNQ